MNLFVRLLFTALIILIFPILNFSQLEDGSIVNRSNGIDIYLVFKQEPYSKKVSGNKTFIEYYNAVDESSPGSPTLPSKTYLIAIPPSSQVKLQLTEQKYDYINNVEAELNPEVILSKDSSITYKESKPDLSKFYSDQYPVAETEVIGYTWIRDYYCAVIKVNTHNYNWKKKEIRELQSCKLKINFSDYTTFNLNQSPLGEFDKKLKDLIFNFKSASQFRSFRPSFSIDDSTGNWIDYSQEYVKLQIPEDGIYRIDYNQVVSFGINPQSINPKKLKIFFKGREIPIYVAGENDLTFDPGDYIEFWADKNYSSPDYREIVSVGEDYLNYFNRYSDTTIVWLAWDGNDGHRVNIQNIIIPGLTDTLSTHKAFKHFEEDERLWYYDSVLPRVQLPFWQENKVWTWKVIGNGGDIPFNFIATNFVPNTPVNVVCRMISNATNGLFTNNHRFGMGLNNTSPQDTIVFNYKETVNFSSVYNSNQLISGDNILRVFGMQNDSLRWHQALIDWVDIEFQRYNVASNDSLLLRVTDGTQAAKRVVKISNIVQPQANMLVYKIKPFIKKIDSFNLTNSVMTFTDTVSAGEEYFIIKDSSVRTPIFITKKYFVNLRNPNHGADYITITNKILESSAEEYINFIGNNYNLRKELIFVDDIYDEFAYGYNKPESIKEFLKFANSNWISPAPSYLLLLGDANYDYKKKLMPPPTVERKNLVPSYGFPVSDAWFTMWDSSNVNLPQMFVGRIPAASNEDVNFYRDKYQTYLSRGYDDFNKRYFFFSGGDIEDPLQLSQLKAANDSVINSSVKPAPIGGETIHFYKTVNPPTNFGPYTQEQINNAIDSSGLFISYIGHSGTESWDNGILEVSDLKSSFPDRLSLITDFGCSTGKFAEPDVDAFSELFICHSQDGQAINYLGNASWGYVSTSVNFPPIFYHQLLLDSSTVISEEYFLAKLELFNQYGLSDVNRVFNYCNTFFGDPLISLRLPPKPNFSINNSSFSMVDFYPVDLDDSTQIKIEIINFGEVTADSVLVTVQDFYLGNQSFFKEFKIPSPLYKKNIIINIPVLGLVGEHNLRIELDKNNLVDEIYENDNVANFNFIVYSTSVRPLEVERYYNVAKDSFLFLNPVVAANESISSMKVSFADNEDFLNSIEADVNIDTVISVYHPLAMQLNKRYWWRVKLNTPEAKWSKPFSLYNENFNYDWYINHSFNQSDIQTANVAFDTTNNSWKLTNFNNTLEIVSAGFSDGSYGSIKLNDFERLPNTYYWGIATAVIDSLTLEPSNFKYFVYHEPMIADSLLIAYIDSLPTGSLLAMTISTDGAQSVLGYSHETPVRLAIETLGSLYVDSVLYRDSWCMIGKKGAPQGSVPESFRKQFSGPAVIDTSLTVFYQNGWVEFPEIKNSKQWLDITKIDSIISGSSLSIIPLGIKNDNSIDTLSALTFSDNVADLSNIDANTYVSLKFLAEFQANQNFETPFLKTLGVNFIPVPELGTNYQVVSITTDTVTIGEDVGFSFYVYNVGESKADSFNVKVEVINADNSRQTIFTQRLDSLNSDERKFFNLTYNTSPGSGLKTFLINIDSDNEVRELFEDNNFFTVPFFVQQDTTTPTVTLTFDGNDILDGDYISPTPVIHIELNDQSLLPITDPSSVLVYLNEELIPSDTSIISYTFSSTNPKVKVDFTPILSDGEYSLKVIWKDSEGNIVDSSGVERFFLVSNEAKLLDVYNYPNPTSGETHFTFKLTQIPEEIRIKIFTIAGRLVKELKYTSSDLKYDFNKLYWNGRDEDGDLLGNGVYLYKVIMKAGDKTEDVTQKLAIVK
jgi:hypothetical protein